MVGVAALLGLVLVLGVGGYAYVQYRFHQINREKVVGLAPITDPPKSFVTGAAPPNPSVRGAVPPKSSVKAAAPVQAQAPYNILLVGDNCRDCLDGTQANVYGSAADVGGGRSDVTMLLHVDPNTDRVAVLSIPRDLWLPVPDSDNEIRVDAALNNGPGALVTTIEDALNIPINHYIELNFDTFQHVVDAVGGLNMYFPARVYDAFSGLNLPTGCFHLNGTQALQVARARHMYYQVNGSWRYDGLGDISRIQRDHEFLKVLVASVSSKGLSNPVTDNNLISSIAKDLTIDNTFTLGSLVDLAKVFSHVDLAATVQATLSVDEDNSPDGYTFKGTQYGDVVFPSNAADQAAITSFLGHPAAGTTMSRSTLPVAVVNGSGRRGQAEQVATQLRALGFPVSGTSTGHVNSDPAETVVYYGPGHEPAAQRLAADLGGAVTLGQDAALAGNGLTLFTGTNLTVAAPAPAATTGPAGSASPHTPARTAVAGPPAAAAIGGLTQTTPGYPSFDPTSCPAGQSASTPPALPAPNSNDLPQT